MPRTSMTREMFLAELKRVLKAAEHPKPDEMLRFAEHEFRSTVPSDEPMWSFTPPSVKGGGWRVLLNGVPLPDVSGGPSVDGKLDDPATGMTFWVRFHPKDYEIVSGRK